MSLISIKEPAPQLERQSLPHFFMIRDQQANVCGYIQGCENDLDAATRALLDQKMEKVLKKTDRIFVELIDADELDQDQFERLRPTFSQLDSSKIKDAVDRYWSVFASAKALGINMDVEVRKKELAELKPVDQLFDCIKLHRAVTGLANGACTQEGAPYSTMGYYLAHKFNNADKNLYELYSWKEHSARLNQDHKPEDFVQGMLNPPSIEKCCKFTQETMKDWMSDVRYKTEDLHTSGCFALRILKDLKEKPNTKALYACSSTLLYDAGGVLPLLEKHGYELLKTV